MTQSDPEHDDDGPFRRFRAKYRGVSVEGQHYFEASREFAEKWGEDNTPNYYIDKPYRRFVSRNSLKDLVWLD